MKRSFLALAALALSNPSNAQSANSSQQRWEYASFSTFESIKQQGEGTVILSFHAPNTDYTADSLVDLARKMKVQGFQPELGYMNLFNILGNDGWELVNCVAKQVAVRGDNLVSEDCYFKRLKK